MSSELTYAQAAKRLKELQYAKAQMGQLSINDEIHKKALEIALPILEQQERGEGDWNGEGMPPVGCECGARKKSPGAGWWNFKVEHISSGCIFGFWKKSGQGAALDGDEYDFMPLNPARTNQNGEQ